jgi:DNA polymerase sigma
MIVHFLQTRGVFSPLESRRDDHRKPPAFGASGMAFVPTLDRREGWRNCNNESVGELLVGFFKYYASEFPYVHGLFVVNDLLGRLIVVGIIGVASIRTGGIVTKDDKGWTRQVIRLQFPRI